MMSSRAMLVGLDNPKSDDPRMALHPIPENATGGRLVKLIRMREPEYKPGRYLLDFYRVNLYPTGHAPTRGVGFRAQDRSMAAHVMTVLDIVSVGHVILLGRRVTEAFDEVIGDHLDYLKSAVVEHHGSPITFWSLPHPSGRNYWYNDDANVNAASKLLNYVRPKTGATA